MVLGNLSGFISSTHTRTQHRSTLNVIPAEILNLIFNRVSRFHPFSYFSQFLFGTLLKGKSLFLKKLLIKSQCQRFFNIFKMLDFSKHQIQENVQISFLAKKAHTGVRMSEFKSWIHYLLCNLEQISQCLYKMPPVSNKAIRPTKQFLKIPQSRGTKKLRKTF